MRVICGLKDIKTLLLGQDMKVYIYQEDMNSKW
jgi:hypothetical protein